MTTLGAIGGRARPTSGWAPWSTFDRSVMATIRLPTDFKKFLRLLNSGGVEYLVVGGYAVALHGHPRSTGDLDIWIATTPNNVARVRRALTEFGFSEELAASAPLHIGGKVIRMGRPPLRIELLTSVSGVAFDASYRRRAAQIVDDVEVAFISRADLLANKRAAGRTQDLADLEALG